MTKISYKINVLFLAEATADPPLENHMDGSNIIEISARNNDLDDIPNNENIRNEELENPEVANALGGGVAAAVILNGGGLGGGNGVLEQN